MTRLLATAALVFSLSSTALADGVLRFEEGTARVQATVPANGTHTITMAGKSFSRAEFTQKSGPKLAVKIHGDNQFLSSGHTTGFQVSNAGAKTYTVVLLNKTGNPATVVLDVAASGGNSR